MANTKRVYPEGQHDLDVDTGYCMRCGAHSDTIYADLLPCCGGDNLIAMSHIRAAQMIMEDRLKATPK